MIKVEPRDGSYQLGFTIQGHADYAERGQDIVCAAVSAVAQMAVIGLEEYTELQHDQADGLIAVEMHPIEEGECEAVNALIYAMYTSLKAIEEFYPDNLQVESGRIE